MRRLPGGLRALLPIACLVGLMSGGCQSGAPTTTRPYDAPPRVIEPDGDWHFKAYRLPASPTPSPMPTPRR